MTAHKPRCVHADITYPTKADALRFHAAAWRCARCRAWHPGHDPTTDTAHGGPRAVTTETNDHVLFRATPRSWTPMAAQLRDLDDGAPHEALPTDLLGDPHVLRAVRSLLGDRARSDGCAHVHLNSSPEPGPWHADDYCGQPWPPGVQFAVLCYFPQDTPAAMGPTAIRTPGGQEITGAGPAGTCLLMRHTVQHRSGANTTGRRRLMLKYLFRDDAQ